MFTLALVVALVIAALLAFVASKPDAFRVERATSVNAPPEKIVPLIEDFHRWSTWSPYEKLDPAMKRNYAGAERGPGAIYTWEGDKSGAGRMEILDVSPARVAIQLDFTKPMAAHNLAEFLLQPDVGVTKVTWAMSGPSPFMSKLMSVFMSMDSLVGKEFETGLASLKAEAER